MNDEKAHDEMKVQKIGESLCIFIPKRIVNFLELNKADIVCVDAETGKYGKYMSAWKKEE